MRKFLGVLILLLLGGCQLSSPGTSSLQGNWWSIGFAEPAYMTVLVETSAVEDIQGRLFRGVASGVAGGGISQSSNYESDTDIARGWSGPGQPGMPAIGADLPKSIYVRWQSIVEQKTYKGWVDISQETREIMRRSTQLGCAKYPGDKPSRGGLLSVGLAPGGAMQVWVWDECTRAIKVDRGQAEIEPLGPDQGRNEGRYGWKISESSKRYIERFGIPYGSW